MVSRLSHATARLIAEPHAHGRLISGIDRFVHGLSRLPVRIDDWATQPLVPVPASIDVAGQPTVSGPS
jgi:hypothetical protein